MDIINFAFIGCGRIANRHLDAIHSTPHARLVAVCDIDLERAKNLGTVADVPYYTDYHHMLKHHPDVNVVTLLTPSGIHFEQAIDIIEHYQKHLLIEKPFILTTTHALALNKAAELHQVKIFPLYQNRFNKAVERVKQGMDNLNELGKLRVGTVRVRWCRPQRYYDMSPWRGTWAMDGGALTNQGIHFIDLMRYLCGEVKRVHAKLATLGAEIEVEDTGVAILEFESGSLGVIEIMTSARPDDFEASISCVCENGLAVISGVAANQLQTFTPDPAQADIFSETFTNVYGYGHNTIIQGVIDTLLTGKNPVISFDDGLKTIQLLHALYRSDELDRWVNVNDVGDSTRLGSPNESLLALYRYPDVLNDAGSIAESRKEA